VILNGCFVYAGIHKTRSEIANDLNMRSEKKSDGDAGLVQVKGNAMNAMIAMTNKNE